MQIATLPAGQQEPARKEWEKSCARLSAASRGSDRREDEVR